MRILKTFQNSVGFSLEKADQQSFLSMQTVFGLLKQNGARMLNDFAGTHIVYRDSVYRAMVQAGVDGPDAEPELACEEMGAGALGSLVHANDKCHAEAYAISTARRVLARLEGA